MDIFASVPMRPTPNHDSNVSNASTATASRAHDSSDSNVSNVTVFSNPMSPMTVVTALTAIAASRPGRCPGRYNHRHEGLASGAWLVGPTMEVAGSGRVGAGGGLRPYPAAAPRAP